MKTLFGAVVRDVSMVLVLAFATLSLAAVLPHAALAQRSEAEAQAGSKTITIFAAASLKTALDAAVSAYEAAHGVEAVVSYAASSALAKQIEHGAPADIFISADLDWMDYLTKAGEINAATRVNVFGNRLVLVAPAASTIDLKIEKGFALADALGDGRLAVGNIQSVPAGKYAKAALDNLGVFASVEGKLAEAENVRAALALVARGEAPLGIVYRTDAVADPAVKIAGEFPAESHPPIIYPVAVTASSTHVEESVAVIAYLTSPDGRAHLQRHIDIEALLAMAR